MNEKHMSNFASSTCPAPAPVNSAYEPVSDLTGTGDSTCATCKTGHVFFIQNGIWDPQNASIPANARRFPPLKYDSMFLSIQVD